MTTPIILAAMTVLACLVSIAAFVAVVVVALLRPYPLFEVPD